MRLLYYNALPFLLSFWYERKVEKIEGNKIYTKLAEVEIEKNNILFLTSAILNFIAGVLLTFASAYFLPISKLTFFVSITLSVLYLAIFTPVVRKIRIIPLLAVFGIFFIFLILFLKMLFAEIFISITFSLILFLVLSSIFVPAFVYIFQKPIYHITKVNGEDFYGFFLILD